MGLEIRVTNNKNVKVVRDVEFTDTDLQEIADKFNSYGKIQRTPSGDILPKYIKSYYTDALNKLFKKRIEGWG
jgi:hypothetical protein